MLVKADKSGAISVPDNLSVDTISVFRSLLTEWLSNTPARVLLDCSALDHVTSSHINLLWQARMMSKEKSVPLYLTMVSANLINVLKVLDLFEEFEIETHSASNASHGKEVSEQVSDGELKFEFRVDSISISEKLVELREFLEKIRVPEESRVELETVFYEVVTNIRLHSGLGPHDTVLFQTRSTRSKITLEFIDSGVAYNPTEQDVGFEPKAAIKEGKRRGFGLIMISRMSSYLSYERRDDSNNVLTVEKQWGDG